VIAEAGPQPGFIAVLDQLPNTQKFDKEARETLLDVFRDAAEFWAEKKVPFRVFYSFEEPQSPQSVGWVGRGRLNTPESKLSSSPMRRSPLQWPSLGPRLRRRRRVQCALMKNIVILISGRGSNMEAIVRAREGAVAGPDRRRDQQ
jgi:hypothetical protein